VLRDIGAIRRTGTLPFFKLEVTRLDQTFQGIGLVVDCGLGAVRPCCPLVARYDFRTRWCLESQFARLVDRELLTCNFSVPGIEQGIPESPDLHVFGKSS